MRREEPAGSSPWVFRHEDPTPAQVRIGEDAVLLKILKRRLGN